jgi:hypothetical protein
VSAVVRSRSTSMGSVDCDASYCGARCACTVAGLSSDSDVASDEVQGGVMHHATVRYFLLDQPSKSSFALRTGAVSLVSSAEVTVSRRDE